MSSITPAFAMTQEDDSEGSKVNVTWSVMATAHSPVQPISEFLGDWHAPLDSGDHAYAQGRALFELTPDNSAISYGLGWRYDYLMTFSEQTAEVYWRYKNQSPTSSSQRLPLFLDAQHNERIGASMGITKQVLPNWQVVARANLWQGLHALDGKIIGDLSTVDLSNSQTTNIRDNLGEAHADINYYYDKPALGEENLGWNPDKPSGYGYSLDLHLAGNLSENTKVSINAYDVLGRMYWEDMPSTRYTLDYDINGRPLYTIEGQLDTEDMTQSLPWRVEGRLSHQLADKWQVSAHGQINDVQSLYQLEASYQPDLMSSLTVSAMAEPQTQAFGIGLTGACGGVKVLTDDIDFNRAQRSEVQLYGRYTW